MCVEEYRYLFFVVDGCFIYSLFMPLLCFSCQLSALQRLQQQQAEDLRKRIEEVNTLNQTVARLQQELTDTKSSLLKKNEELATITEDLGAKEALLTDTKNKELQVVLYYLYSEVSVTLTEILG